MPVKEWSDDELQDAVEAYLHMFDTTRQRKPFVKKRIYEALGAKHGRAPAAFERRMMNISAVLEAAGYEWLPGLAPNRNVGSAVAPRIERALQRAGAFQRPQGPLPLRPASLEAWPMPKTTIGQTAKEESQVAPADRSDDEPKMPPPGVLKPREVTPTTRTFARDEAVKAWVLARSKGACECCKKPAPFVDSAGVPFLEVHHLKQLANGGSDTVTNAVAVCPNCHRELHHGRAASDQLASIYASVADLVRE